MTQILHVSDDMSDEHPPADNAPRPYYAHEATYQNLENPDRTLAVSSPGVYPQFLLFGDSITQQSTLTVQPNLQTLYVRRLDILNRGYSGYTAPLGLQTLPHFLPVSTPAADSAPYVPQIKLITVFFGANDACLPGNAQHVPLTKYLDALKLIVNYPVLKRHDTKIIIITPPPIDEHQFPQPFQRTAANTARYARAAHNLANDLDIPCVDIWTAILEQCGYTAPKDGRKPDYSNLPGSSSQPKNETLASLLHDGLHLTPKGYDILFRELMAVIRNQLPEYLPENLPIIFKEWRDVFNVPVDAPGQ